MKNRSKERQAMVSEQIRLRGVKDPRVIEAMASVPRHLFVPQERSSEAYDDNPIPIGHGQTISQPYIVAYMTEALELGGEERVLEIGTGSGYQAAVLSRLAAEVYTMENIQELAHRAARRLQSLGYPNVHVKWGDGYLGWPEEGPFDAILATAAPPKVPDHLMDQLAVPGRMVVPVGELLQQIVRIRKGTEAVRTETCIPVRFVPMVHKRIASGR
jgi:protein-L-isoaspartate(D-aspartate) O-methyltransferase